MSRTDVSQLSSYTVTNGDAQIYYNNPVNVDINITLPKESTAKWNNYPIIYITNMSPDHESYHPWMTFHLASGVKVKAPDSVNYVSNFSIRAGFNGYIIYTGNDQWMLQGVGANFNGA
jgi:hypothetical protein